MALHQQLVKTSPEKLGALLSFSCFRLARLRRQSPLTKWPGTVGALHLDLVAAAGEELPKDLVYVAILGDKRQHGCNQIARQDEAAEEGQRVRPIGCKRWNTERP